MTIHAYLPQDRLNAIAHGDALPDRTSGSALFADISGFTALTVALRELLGSRRGAEELTKHLDTIYTALIGEVEKYGGSVISFAGDAITCWFDEGQTKDDRAQAAARAVSCAIGLQAAMKTFKSIAQPNEIKVSLTLKVTVASGPARRFVVGNPEIYYIDTLVGATVARTSSGERLSESGEILVDEATVAALGEILTIKEWRTDTKNGEKFAVAEKLNAQLRIQPFSNSQLLKS